MQARGTSSFQPMHPLHPSLFSEDTLTSVIMAIQVLFPHTHQDISPSQRAAADAYLRSFQLTPSAYTISIELVSRHLSPPLPLSPSSRAIVFFASQTLANKVRRHHPFPKELDWTFSRYFNCLLCFLSFASENAVPLFIQVQLVLALVRCLVRMDSHEIHQQSHIQFALHELMQAKIRPQTVAQILSLLVEEVHDVSVRSIREHLQQDISNWSDSVLNQILPQILQNAIQGTDGKQNLVIQVNVLQAIKNWVCYARIKSSDIQSNAIIQALIPTFLGQEELFDASLDLILELVYQYQNEDQDMQFMLWILPQILGLKEIFYRALQDEDFIKAHDLSRLFTETAVYYSSLFVSTEELYQCEILQLMLDCLSCKEIEVADSAIGFWLQFLELLCDMPDSEAKQKLMAKYQSALMQLLSVCVESVQFKEDFPRLPSDKQQEFKSFRHALSDIMRYCSELMDICAILERLMHGLEPLFKQSQGEQPKWQAMEALLCGIRFIARQIESSEQAQKSCYLPILFKHLPQCCTHPAIRYTACLIISRYASWLASYPEFISQQFIFLVQSILMSAQDTFFADWEVAIAAATAMRSIASDSWAFVGQDTVQFFLRLDSNDAFHHEQVLLLEGICIGMRKTYEPLTATNATAVLELLQIILQPTLERVSSALHQAPSNSNESCAKVMDALLRFICVYDYLSINSSNSENVKDPMLWLTEKLWPLLYQSLTYFPENDELVERVCRCYKRILRCCSTAYATILPQMTQHLIELYQLHPKSSYLYTGSTIIRQYHSWISESENAKIVLSEDLKSSLCALFAEILYSFTSVTSQILFSAPVQQLQSYADTVEEYFYLMDLAARVIPNVLFQVHTKRLLPVSASQGDISASFMAQVIEHVPLALSFPHHNMNKSVLCFMESLLDSTNKRQDPGLQSVLDVMLFQESISGISASKFRYPGQIPCSRIKVIIHQLLKGLIFGNIASSRIDADHGSIAGVLVAFAKCNAQALQKYTQEWTRDLYSIIASQTPNNSESAELAPIPFLTQEELEEFVKDLFETSHERAFRRVCRHFHKLCASRYSVSAMDVNGAPS